MKELVDPFCRKVMEEEDWWILYVGKSRRRGLEVLYVWESHERRGLVDPRILYEKRTSGSYMYRKVMEEEDWWIL